MREGQKEMGEGERRKRKRARKEKAVKKYGPTDHSFKNITRKPIVFSSNHSNIRSIFIRIIRIYSSATRSEREREREREREWEREREGGWEGGSKQTVRRL